MTENEVKRSERVANIDVTSPNLPIYDMEWGRFIFQMTTKRFIIPKTWIMNKN